MIKIIQDLGMRDVGARKKVRFLLVECPVCKEHFEARSSNVKSKRTTKCKKCANKKHSASGSKLYRMWEGFKARSTNKNHRDYQPYGMANSWEEYENNEKWAKSNGYEDGLLLIREDQKIGYYPFNCIFGTRADLNKIRAGLSVSKDKYMTMKNEIINGAKKKDVLNKYTISQSSYHRAKNRYDKDFKGFNKTHGASGSKLYHIWSTMKDRTTREGAKFYHRYGGRGIKVCDEWKDSFESFMKWSIENGYKDGLSIDRIDNDGDYEPSNCQWITVSENSEKNRKLTEDIYWKMQKEIDNGKTIQSICKKYEFGEATFYRARNKFNDFYRDNEKYKN